MQVVFADWVSTKENLAMAVLIFQTFCIAGVGFLVFVLVNFVYDEKRNRKRSSTRPSVSRPERTPPNSGRR
jgi:hypothetical protein